MVTVHQPADQGVEQNDKDSAQGGQEEEELLVLGEPPRGVLACGADDVEKQERS